MGFFSGRSDSGNPLELASRLIDVARAGKLADVRNIAASSTVNALDAKLRGELLALGLFEAAAEGHLEVVRCLAQAGANLDRPHPSGGHTALTIAAFTGRDSIVTLLVELGADVNAKTVEGITALMVAAGRCTLATVKSLLDAGADPNVIAQGGLTASSFAGAEGRHDVLRLLTSSAS